MGVFGPFGNFVCLGHGLLVEYRMAVCVFVKVGSAIENCTQTFRNFILSQIPSVSLN